MSRTIKVFCSSEEKALLAKKHTILADYEAFVLMEADEKKAKQLARRYPVEDITSSYALTAGATQLDTSIPRIVASGKAQAHPAYKSAKTLSKGAHHYLVQFIGPIKEEWLKQVKKAGGQPRSPYGAFAYVVRADDKALAQLAALPVVRWVGHLPHEARIAPNVQAHVSGQPGQLLPRTRIMPGVYSIEFFGSDDLKAALPFVRKLKLKVVSQQPKAKLLVIEVPATVKLDRKTVSELAAVHGVRYIRERALKRTSNNIASGIMGAGASVSSPGLGLDGRGEVVAVCDTGLDTGNANTVHPDFAGRVAFTRSYPINPVFNSLIFNPNSDDGAADFDSGHGTHVAGSVLGNGAASQGTPGLTSPICGLAHKANLVFQAIEQEMRWRPEAPLRLRRNRYILSGIPDDLTVIFHDAFQRQARIHTNSWGGGNPGEYDEQCQQLDQYVWDHKDFCILFAAGNDGSDPDADGNINSMSVTPPGTAKNCITVGASENLRPEFNGERYGDWWPSDFPAPPIKADPMANNQNQIVAFSSRGPTADGRIKPDVVAPGTFILSTRSSQIAPNNMAWAAFPPNHQYFYMGGTSMATPLTAGAAALVRQFYRTRHNIARPTAALLKATLIAGATRLPGMAANALRDNHQGFGRVNLDACLAPPTPTTLRFLEATPGLRTGESRRLTLNVRSNQVPLRVVLVYSDFPGPQLVNNLNLILTAPNGRRYVGNQAVSGVLQLDQTNNVEVVHAKQPRVGLWTLDVIGSNVPQGPQEFALVWLGHVS